jgi:hypothetical protein
LFAENDPRASRGGVFEHLPCGGIHETAGFECSSNDCIEFMRNGQKMSAPGTFINIMEKEPAIPTGDRPEL